MKKFLLLFGSIFFISTPITFVISCTSNEENETIDFEEEEVQLLDDFKFKLTSFIKDLYSSKKNSINISYNESQTNGNVFIKPDILDDLDIDDETGNLIISNEQFYRLQKDFDKIINLESLKKYVNDSLIKDHNYSRIKKFIPNQLINSIEIDKDNVNYNVLSEDKKNLQLKISSRVHYQYFDLNKTLQTKFTSPINLTITILEDEKFIDVIDDFVNGYNRNFFDKFFQNEEDYGQIFYDIKEFRDNKEKYKIANYEEYISDFANNKILALADIIKQITDNFFESVNGTDGGLKLLSEKFKINEIDSKTLNSSLLKFSNSDITYSPGDTFLNKLFLRMGLGKENSIDLTEISKILAEKVYTKNSIDNHKKNSIDYINKKMPLEFAEKIESFFENPIAYSTFSFNGISISNERGVTIDLDEIELPILIYLSKKNDSMTDNNVITNNLATDGIVETFEYFFKDVLGLNEKKANINQVLLDIHNSTLTYEMLNNKKEIDKTFPIFSKNNFLGVDTRETNSQNKYSGFKEMKADPRYQTTGDLWSDSDSDLNYWSVRSSWQDQMDYYSDFTYSPGSGGNNSFLNIKFEITNLIRFNFNFSSSYYGHYKYPIILLNRTGGFKPNR